MYVVSKTFAKPVLTLKEIRRSCNAIVFLLALCGAAISQISVSRGTTNSFEPNQNQSPKPTIEVRCELGKVFDDPNEDVFGAQEIGRASCRERV